jgi:DNA-binding response OmpR family regulator
MIQHHVLLVDDEPHVLRVLRLSLERAGYSVATANDGNDALSEIAKCRPDVLVTDIKMDGMNGRTLCQLVRKMYPEDLFLILVMTSMTAADERVWVQQLQNIEFLEKPLSPRQLVARLFRHFTINQ